MNGATSPTTAAPDDLARVRLFDAEIVYAVPGTEQIFYPTERHKSSMPAEPHVMPIHDMRAVRDRLSFDRNGFVLVEQQSKVRNFRDPQEIESVYLPEVERLVMQLTGAEKTISFGQMYRSDAADTTEGSQPAYAAHVDYGDRTVRQFSRDILGEEEAERWLQRRFMLINVWRPIVEVRRSPLALVDASTVRRDDLVVSEVRGGLGDPNRPTLYGWRLTYNPEHRWFHVPRMQPHEVMAFRLYDSDPDAVQLTGHLAFNDPTAADDAPPRQSIEVRTISFMPA
jgi:hypothetical protein